MTKKGLAEQTNQLCKQHEMGGITDADMNRELAMLLLTYVSADVDADDGRLGGG